MKVWFLAPAVLIAACVAPAPVGYGPSDAPVASTTRPVTEPSRGVSGSSEATVDARPRFYPPANLYLCRTTISNQPDLRSDKSVANYNRLVLVDGHTILVTAPAERACLSSGFGPRYGRPHKGIDLLAKPASMVFSGGAGTVKEVRTANGYGLYVLIDHGRGVFTRYAHMERVNSDVAVGKTVYFGQPIGLMGRSGNATAIHLHYEILTGSYDNPRRSFGLVARNPLSFPAYVASASS